MERQQNDGLRKTPELSSEFQRLKAEHLEKMAGLKQESEMLKQLTEIERMKKELNEIKGNKVVVTNDEDKQKYETPFLMSTSGMEKSLLPSPYDPSAGFSVFLDFVLGMPSSSIKCRLAVGIYNVTELVSDVKVLPLVNVVNKHNSRIPSGGVAVFGIMYPFPKCAPIQTLSVIAELQANSTDDPQDPHKLFSKGWTKMDLFDTADRLISGRWKIPFRVPPIKTYLSYNELNRIPQDNPVHHYSRQRIVGKTPSTRESIDEPPLPPPTAPYRRDMRGAISLTSLKSEHNHSDSSSSITGFQVDQLYKAIDGEAKIKITAYSQQDGEILKAAGDTPVMCVTKSCKQDFLKDIYVFGLQEVRFRQVQWNSKSIVVVRVYLQPKDPGTDQIPAVNLLDESRLAAWTLIPLGYSNGRLSRQSAQGVGSSSSLNVGIHTVPIFFPPVPEITDMPVKIDKYPSEWSRYGRAALTMAIFSGFQRPLESPSPPPEYVEENEVPKNAWLKNARSFVTNKMFTPGSGFDLYIDGVRFLPDSVTVSKVAGRVMDKNYDKVGPDVEAQSKLYSDIYNPEFDHRLEFREPVFPATSTLMLKVYTVDRLSKKLCCLGYAVLPIFLKLGSTDPPSNNSDTEKFSLNEGAHQIRIFNGAPDFSQPLGPSLIQKLKPVPCASLLVRIVLAACHPNGRPKETSEFPESQWEREGLVVAKQRYEEG
ncbi:uncharacterized protein LOC116299741 isoform X2 [Actinia tenebrosa]|uniref:Uncharacterized protein LOC116299741 isoform X2 n=1 Tax=Actinia tenebrosa TaxID=6105 RepID=A0A6P8I6Y3_ACTTE|nr:uncharacterized protein LOC116299741 isoform X2 [Actinia tenebrosa]